MPFLGHWYVLLIVLAIVLIVYGPGKLPEVGGAIGKAMREFRRQSTELTEEFKKSVPTDNPGTSTPASDARPTSDVKPASDIKS